MQRVVFFVMNEKGEQVLRRLIERYGAEIVRFVVVPRPHECSVGDRLVEIRDLCAAHGIECHQRHAYPHIDEYAFAVGWRWMIADVKQLIITHDSLLPEYRGFAPLIAALVKGEPKVGVTAFIANGRYDEGNILGQRSVDLHYPIKIQEAIRLVIPLYIKLIMDIIDAIRRGETPGGTPQNDAAATYSLWLDQDDYRIDWTQDAATLQRFIDAVGHPYDGAGTVADGQLYRVLNSEKVDDVTIVRRHPGKVIFLDQGFPTVVCGTGLLKITDLRDGVSGASVLPWRKFRTRFR